MLIVGLAPLTKEQIANRVRQQLDMLTSLAATESVEQKRESKDSTTRRERSRKPGTHGGEREIIRSASDESCHMPHSVVCCGVAEGEAESTKRGEELGRETVKAAPAGRRRRGFSRCCDGMGEDAGPDVAAGEESGEAKRQQDIREGDNAMKELESGRKGRGRPLKGRGCLSDGQLCLGISTAGSNSLRPPLNATSLQHPEGAAGAEVCSGPGHKGEEAGVGETAQVVSPRGRQVRTSWACRCLCL